MTRRRPFFVTFLAPAVVTAVILAAAILEVLQYSVREFIPGSLDVGGFTLENFVRINRPIYWLVLLDTFYISLLTAVFSLLLSYPVAYALVRAKRDWVRSLLISLSITPLFTGEIVRTLSWMLTLGADGFVNSILRKLSIIDMPIQLMYTRFGVVVALVQFSMPVMIILLATAISHVDRDCEKAAANLGASPTAVFWRITLPLTMPGILSGVVVIFAWTMSAFSTPQLIGGGKVLMISNLAYLQGFSVLNMPFAATLSLIALVAALGSLALMKSATGRLEKRLAIH
ncbi:ABC transporter permease [Ancylobacter sp. MQZ15Z-1]|uniref:ABC transporter permease n=1 Tax=Ancylobacter mangrovi TaxID=2972472 RepID=A0A9X2PBE9_9HYPH|nr:ABC transporter permease [Ancylobacter mangrovi]MCS0494314.1 ABC transporter permease [Ancylobacter mangrovi]